MARITYDDKDNSEPLGTPKRTARAQDYNEIKNVVNTNESLMAYKPVPFEPSDNPAVGVVVPSTGGTLAGGGIQNGFRFITTRDGYLPGEGGAEFWARKAIGEALDDNPGQDPTKWKYY